MSTSASPPVPASSPPAYTAFPEDMVGRLVKLFLSHRQAIISGVERQEDQERAVTLIKFEASGDIGSGKLCRLETEKGLRFHGIVNMEETSKASILVEEDAVWACRCCTHMGVPTPPFSSTIKGMTLRFSESDPQTIEATVREVEKLPSLSAITLEMNSLPPYSLHIGDRIVLRSGLNTWQANVMYFGDHDLKQDEVFASLGHIIHIHVLDENGPKSLPHTKIVIRPAKRGSSNIAFSRGGTSQKKRRSSAFEESEANQKKIKVGINGYRDIGRALARVAMDSETVDLVAINDPSITDQVSCMFWNSRCDFEVKSSSGILSFGTNEVNFFEESDHRMVPWHWAGTQLVVTSYSKDVEDYYKKVASQYSKSQDHSLSGSLEIMLGTSTADNKWAPVLKIQPISPKDAKAVSDCFPLWKGKRVASKFCFQGADVLFVLGEYPEYKLLPNGTESHINLRQIVKWCFQMLSHIPAVAVCDVEISERPTY